MLSLLRVIFYFALIISFVVFFIMSVADYFKLNYPRLWGEDINTDLINPALMFICAWGAYKAVFQLTTCMPRDSRDSLRVSYKKKN